MNEDELSVRLEWGERSTVPFRPPTDETGEPPPPRHDGSPAGRLAQLERSLGDLQAEVARLRADIARLHTSSTPKGKRPPPDASTSRDGAQGKDRPRPIRVRAKRDK